jgi:hypothetical protein
METAGLEAVHFLDGIDSVAAREGRGYQELVVHSGREDILELALERGYGFWDDTSGPNLLVFRLGQEIPS